MRIASYNIMSGGFDGYDLLATEPQRLPKLQIAIRELHADVLGLVDTFRWKELYSASELCQLFGYKHAFCITLEDDRLGKDNGDAIGLTLLSTIALTDVRAIRIATRNAITARLAGSEINLVLAYLDDLSEDTRLAQVEALASILTSSEPTIVMGDLNSLAGSDIGAVQDRLAHFYRNNPQLIDSIAPVMTDMQRGEVVAALEALGLRDADQTGQPTVPTKLFPAAFEQPFLRLDYCLHTPSATVTNFTVPRQAIFQEASDHFPIVFDVAIG